MRKHSMPNTNLLVSSFCYGVERFGTVAKDEEMYRLYEQYCNAGGNFFDTAHGYAAYLPNGDGASERGLGKCLQKFGNRKDVIITTKGGLPKQGNWYPRPDDCLTPEVISSDISESMERLQVDEIDIYILHRDDPRHSVAEIIDLLNVEINQGRIRFIGASNWTIERIEEANAYAAAKQLKGFVLSSPLWNLVQMNHSPKDWDGIPDLTTHMINNEDIAWHRKNQFPIMSWNPTAYGFIAGSAGEQAQQFDNATSRERRERARQLAKEQGCTPNQIGIAYLRAYSNDFPVFPILGSMKADHLADAIGADDVTLTPQQREWLLNG